MEQTMKPIIDISQKLPTHPSKHYADNRTHERIRSIAIHHMAAESSAQNPNPVKRGEMVVRGIANYHVQKGWPGIGYAFFVTKDGLIFKTNPMTTVSFHVGASNRDSVGVCLEGNLDTHQILPPQKEALYNLLHYIMGVCPQVTYKDILGHREYPGYSWKSCPGNAVSMKVIREHVNETAQTVKRNQGKTKGVADR